MVDGHGEAPAGDVSNSVVGGAPDMVLQAGVIEGDVYQYGHPPRTTARLPYRFGRVPPRADAFQPRTLPMDVGDARTVVLSGPGGAGKTQVAVDHAETAWTAGLVDLLVWVTATDRGTVMADYATLAADLTGVEDTDPAAGSRRLLGWLVSTQVRWLIVLDDLRVPSDVNGLWPPRSGSGRTLVTTRRSDAALRGGRHVVPVGMFEPDESAAYLAAKLVPHPGLEAGAVELAQRMRHLPLALAQAAAYLIDRQLTCVEYVRRFDDTRRRLAALLPEPGAVPDEYQATVATTWSMSVDLADRLAPEGLAGPLLEVAALLDPDGIPAAVLAAPAVLGHLAGVTGRNVGAEQARDALTCLSRLSLATFRPDRVHGEVRVHSLVQRATRDAVGDERLAALTDTVAKALLEVWPSVEIDAQLAEALRANAAALHKVAAQWLWSRCCPPVLRRMADSLAEAGRPSEARDHLDQLAETAADRLGSEHRDTLSIRAGAATWAGRAGLLADAVFRLERLVAEQERVLGEDDQDTLNSRSELEYWRIRRQLTAYAVIRTPTEALAEMHKVLTDQIRLLGRLHADTMATRGRIASMRAEIGEPAAAADAFERLLNDQVQVFGLKHPWTLATRNNLWTSRAEAGRAEAALSALRELLVELTRVLGARHVDTLTVRNNIAFWQAELGDVNGATTALRELVADQTRVLGPRHPLTLTTRGHLARRLGDAGDAQGALMAFEKLLADRLDMTDGADSEVRTTRSNVAYWRYIVGDHHS
ncbi:tetratricopeptide repeat protein [Saccharothrix xinjiangensis]|uniref:Tetratricopeptide repeat protein n=1 Tax=Saccharothrix xinjiangensis TaxID=204798 RepID=A0ABV9Y8H5_9PSEU